MSKVEEKSILIFKEFDKKEKNYFSFNEFSGALSKLLGPKEIIKKTKMLEFFSKASSQIKEKDFVTKEEWIFFILNEHEIYIPLFQSYL